MLLYHDHLTFFELYYIHVFIDFSFFSLILILFFFEDSLYNSSCLRKKLQLLMKPLRSFLLVLHVPSHCQEQVAALCSEWMLFCWFVQLC